MSVSKFGKLATVLSANGLIAQKGRFQGKPRISRNPPYKKERSEAKRGRVGGRKVITGDYFEKFPQITIMYLILNKIYFSNEGMEIKNMIKILK